MKNLCEDYSIVRMALVFNVNRGGYYKWVKHPLTQRDLENIKLTKKIKKVFFEYKERYGSPRIAKELKEQGITCSKNRVCRLMKQERLMPKPNQIWTSDLTYIRTRGGWLYLCIILDLFSRKVVGWSMTENMQASMFVKALSMASESRIPDSSVIFHSDRGAQYASNIFREKLAEYNLVQSMSRPGNCLDNAPSKSFFHTLKVEEVYGQSYETRQEAQSCIFEYIEVFYNRKRRHSYFGPISPQDFEDRYYEKLYENVA